MTEYKKFKDELNRFEKKTGYVGSIPAGANSLAFKADKLNAIKMSQVEPDGQTSIIKRHGKYQKIIYEPAPESQEQVRTFTRELPPIGDNPTSGGTSLFWDYVEDKIYGIGPPYNYSGFARKGSHKMLGWIEGDGRSNQFTMNGTGMLDQIYMVQKNTSFDYYEQWYYQPGFILTYNSIRIPPRAKIKKAELHYSCLFSINAYMSYNPPLTQEYEVPVQSSYPWIGIVNCETNQTLPNYKAAYGVTENPATWTDWLITASNPGTPTDWYTTESRRLQELAFVKHQVMDFCAGYYVSDDTYCTNKTNPRVRTNINWDYLEARWQGPVYFFPNNKDLKIDITDEMQTLVRKSTWGAGDNTIFVTGGWYVSPTEPAFPAFPTVNGYNTGIYYKLYFNKIKVKYS
jgi:hypothetical protein